MFEDESAAIKVLSERVRQLEIRCDKKDVQIEKLNEFRNTVVGFAVAISTTCAVIVQFVFNVLKGNH